MAGVRSTTLRAGSAAAGGHTRVLEVPAGKTVLVKSLYGQSFASAAHDVLMAATFPPAGRIYAVGISVEFGKSFRWDGWLALDQGAILELLNGGDGLVSYVMSGTVLPGVADELPTHRPVAVDGRTR